MSNPSVATPITATLKSARSNALLKRWAPALILPMLGIIGFLLCWQLLANNIQTSLGQFPGPVQVSEQFSGLVGAHLKEREKARVFYERQDTRNAALLAKNPDAEIKVA